MCFKFAPRVPVFENCKTRGVAGEIDIARLPLRIVREPVSLNDREKLALHVVKDLTRDRRIDADNEPTVSRNEIHQTREFPLDVVEVVVNIGVVKLDVVDDRDLGQVVHELRLLVEVGRVILVAFDDEMITAGDTKTCAEVMYDATDEETRIEPADLTDPCGDARRCRFAVRPGDDKRSSAADKFFFYDLGLRAIEKFSIEDLF